MQKERQEYQTQLLAKINRVKDINAKEEDLDKLLKQPAYELREELKKNKDLKMTTILQRYHKLKQVEQNKHNDLVEVLYDEPLERCKQLDKEREENKMNYEEKKLVGFYMSIKDSLKLKNTASTCGFYMNLDKICDKNVRTVKHLIEQGVIFTSKGNIPQGIFSMECFSNIFGEGKNPYDLKRTPGGSSGGEAALVRLGLVNCALGSDIAGSLRIPALYNGIVTLKPTAPRLRMDAFTEFFEFQDDAHLYPDFMTYLLPTIGPLTRNVEDCETLMEVMTSDITCDMFSPPIPWKRVNELPKKMGYLKELEICEVSPANHRALIEAKAILEKKGVEFVEIDLNDEIKELYVLAMALYQQVPTLKDLVTKKIKIQEPLVRDFRDISLLVRTPRIFYPFIKYILKKFGQERLILSVLGIDLSKTVNNSYLTKKRFELFERIVEKLKNLGVESFLSYGLATPAISHGSFTDVFMQSVYTFMYNFLNFPAGVIPITRVRKNEQVYESKFNDLMTKGMKKVMEDSEDMPIGIQVVALSWKDELVMKIMREIEDNITENFDCNFQKTFENSKKNDQLNIFQQFQKQIDNIHKNQNS